jgi:hypothetical protein
MAEPLEIELQQFLPGDKNYLKAMERLDRHMQ